MSFLERLMLGLWVDIFRFMVEEGSLSRTVRVSVLVDIIIVRGKVLNIMNSFRLRVESRVFILLLVMCTGVEVLFFVLEMDGNKITCSYMT